MKYSRAFVSKKPMDTVPKNEDDRELPSSFSSSVDDDVRHGNM